ncbi:MgtC/SapB family protein [Cesiribacter sp. SM1]|uniref:MgtC/SapB family protein n=1 Tax=Cesiribacter sp. SM1 TaxID=2861196 RepID=UPI001CD1A30B|nr:MgtC/SapB family protein [Cesiribacter sp. SM1]
MIEELNQFMNVLVAALLTGAIGWEREQRNMPAGLRTNMIVGVSAALLVILGHMMVEFYDTMDAGASLQYDPLRVVQAIIVGVGFIGGGTILKVADKEKIRYLTSAATILISAGIGIAVALERYLLSLLVVGLILTINYGIRKWENHTGRSSD